MAKKFNLADFVQQPDVSNLNHMEVTMIDLDRIVKNPGNFYYVDPLANDLTASIEAHGLLSPLTVIPLETGDYRLISGHRRFAALRRLQFETDDPRWAQAPCIIIPNPDDADREELLLIHANSTARTLSGAELAAQAQRLTEIFVRMKERGVEFTGRMRDQVAAAMEVSSARLARLDAIRNHLTYPGLRRVWERGDLTEAVAYELSRLPYEDQMHVADWCIETGTDHSRLKVKDIQKALKAAQGTVSNLNHAAETQQAPESAAETQRSPVGERETQESTGAGFARVTDEEPAEGQHVIVYDHVFPSELANAVYSGGAFRDAFNGDELDFNTLDWWAPFPAMPQAMREEMGDERG